MQSTSKTGLSCDGGGGDGGNGGGGGAYLRTFKNCITFDLVRFLMGISAFCFSHHCHLNKRRGYKTFFFMLLTIVGISTFISMINTTYESFRTGNILIRHLFSFWSS